MKTALALLLFISVSFAHHGPKKSLHHDNSQRIENLSQKIEEKPSALLYTYRALLLVKEGKRKEAIHDLEHALMLDKDYEPAKKLLKQIK